MYRILDTLKEVHLVEEKLGDRGLEFGAAHPQRLEQLAIEQEIQAQHLVKNSRSFAKQLENLIPNAVQKSKVLYYEGVEGLKQVTYNTIHAKGELRVYEVEHMSTFLDTKYSEHIRQKYVEHAIVTYDLTNKKSFREFTNVHQYIQSFSKCRYVDPKQLKIQFEALIYNDVYATYTYSGNEVFCVEIYNEQLAAMQKQLYDFIWRQARPIKYTTMSGAGSVEKGI